MMNAKPDADCDEQLATTHAAPAGAHTVDKLLAALDKWCLVLGAAGTLCAGAANVKLFLEQQWVFAGAMLALCGFGSLLYVLSHRATETHSRQAQLLRIGATTVLASVPIVTAAAFYLVDFAPRTVEDGPIMAIARFEGPKLPPPYDYCRPSDMLATALVDVAHRYAHVTAFELPYVIDPGGRWAAYWASWHGVLAGADTVVYGEYSFVDNEQGDNKPDRLRILPQVDQVPLLPLGPKVAPLQHWDFPDRVVKIEALCTGRAHRFLQDATRLTLAIVGLQAFAKQEYVSAERALAEAEQRQDEAPDSLAGKDREADDSRCDQVLPSNSQCSGVLAFYLAALEQRLGHYGIAEREYAFAAGKLNRPAPYVDLAELYALENRGNEVLQALRSAESADPRSVVAAATRAEYESQYGDDDVAQLELDRALILTHSRPLSEYEQIVLSRAIYVRNHNAGLAYRLDVPHKGYAQTADAEIELSRWLIATQQPFRVEQGIAELRRAVETHPSNIKANYTLALALAKTGAPDDPDIRRHYLIAVNARAFSDDEFTDQGNAATELLQYSRARELYGDALTINSAFAYAYSNRGTLYKRLGDLNLAQRDLQKAALLHPREFALPGGSASISDVEQK